jgi:anti-anti-sigma regulatory factor
VKQQNIDLSGGFHMSDFRVTESEKGELIMGGALTIENASEIRSRLIKTLVREHDVVICIAPDASADISFLQILCSAHYTASKLGRSFLLSHGSGDAFLSTVENAGYSRSRGCARDTDKTCLWVRGEHD